MTLRLTLTHTGQPRNKVEIKRGEEIVDTLNPGETKDVNVWANGGELTIVESAEIVPDPETQVQTEKPAQVGDDHAADTAAHTD